MEVMRLESIDQKLKKKNKMIYAIEKNLKAQKKELLNTKNAHGIRTKEKE